VVEATGPVSPSPSPRKGRGKKRAGGMVKKRTVRPKECAICGTPFRAPKVEDAAKSFPAARTIRATRSATASQSHEAITVPYEIPKPSVDTSTPMEIDPSPIPDEPTPIVTQFAHEPTTHQPEPEPAPAPPPPKYVYNNGLTHVYTSAPNLPTYPQPPAKHVSPPPKEKNRKRKKSGLAKLLAENKEREGGGSIARGSWGLD